MRAWPTGGAILALLVFAACGLGGPAYGPPPADAAAVITMTNFLNFAPDAMTIRAGETIEWRNRSLFTHTVTADPALAADPADVELPPDGGSFNSGPVVAGQTYRHRFNVPGTYRYVCRPHEGYGMMGTIVVRPRA